MVFYFYPRGYVDGKDDWLIYMGKDKHENEDLIRYGLPVDVWFHVDGLSSAHVYLRLPEGGAIDAIPEETLQDCAQLVKQNSIQGCKQNNVDIVYTPWNNLKKTNSMEVGQVGFHDQKRVHKVSVEKKDNAIINRLEKTSKELYPDLQKEQETYMVHLRAARKVEERSRRADEKSAKEDARRQEDLRSYKHLMKDENMVSNKEMASKYQSVEDFEDDFM